ncbi:DUF3296 domain-containing protein [Escherichia coli]|uniref:DUF3296 domain-containing protein n=1 Tax=Escherichia coli TaxID=562 RepID=UPI001F4BE896|nr:DUF3296 domain-containing protein [Escherichia coli]
MHQDDFCIVNPGGCIIHFPANGRYILDIHDPDFPEQYQRLPAVFDSPVTGGGGEGCHSEQQGKKHSGIHD